jgi:hypothetical protein
MKKKKKMINKVLVIAIFIIFFGTGFLPTIAGDYNNENDTSKLTFYLFDRTGTKKINAELSKEIVEEISFIFKDLKNRLICDPMSVNTNQLKVDYINMLDSNGLISSGLSREYVVSLLNPSWLKWIDTDSPFTRDGFFSSIGSRVKNRFDSGSSSNFGSAAFCSVGGAGSGLLIPPIMLPRPRFVNFWAAYGGGMISAANLLTGNGFAAFGPQFGMTIGFMGVGLSLGVPGEPAYFGFGGYALLAMVGADKVEIYPPNIEPVISEENPVNGERGVSLSLSELSFSISDPDGDRMSYWVTTDPDIGSGDGYLKKDGRYSVPVSGLYPDKSYSWTVVVSDGESVVEKSFGFLTEAGPPFDPFDEGWQYRKKITIDHSLVAGNHSDFPIVIKIVDSDLKIKAQADGDDILFMDDLGWAKKLYHEIEKWDRSSGELVCWVNIPDISSLSDTYLYMYYGNPHSNNQENVVGTWNSDYICVYHFAENAGNLLDSTNNNHDGTFNGDLPDRRDGDIGYSQNFDNSGDFISVNSLASTLNYESDGSLIIYAKGTNIYEGDIFFSLNDYSDDRDYIYFSNDDRSDKTPAGGTDCMCTDLGAGGNWRINSLPNVETGDIRQLIFSSTGSDDKLFLDGHEIITQYEKGRDDGTWFHDTNAGQDTASIGILNRDFGNVGDYDGFIDEFRISKINLSDDWILSEWNNVNNAFNGGFFSLGPEEPST